jgi:hypothetical protein
LVQAFYVLEAHQRDYLSTDIDGKLAGNSSDDVVSDGGGAGGLNPINRASVVNAKAAVDALVTAFGSNVGTTGKTAFQILNAIQHNGSPV